MDEYTYEDIKDGRLIYSCKHIDIAFAVGGMFGFIFGFFCGYLWFWIR